MRLALLLAALGTFASGAEAQQLDFKRISRSGDELLSYRWRDDLRKEHSVAFTLTREAIHGAEDSFAQYSGQGMWQVVEQDLRDEVARFGNGARIDIKRTADGVRWTVETRKSDLDDLTRKVEGRLKRSEQEYLARHLRRLIGERRIIVDFAAATSALQGPLRAVARALGDVPDVPNEDRARVALALGFFQEIPYATLEDKQRRQGGDFLPRAGAAGREPPRRLRQQGSRARRRAAQLHALSQARGRDHAWPCDPRRRDAGPAGRRHDPAGRPAICGARGTGRAKCPCCRSARSGRPAPSTSRASHATSKSGRWRAGHPAPRLAAIVHADLAGFTRLMEGGETRTFRHLKAAQNEVWRPAIEAGGGRLRSARRATPCWRSSPRPSRQSIRRSISRSAWSASMRRWATSSSACCSASACTWAR